MYKRQIEAPTLSDLIRRAYPLANDMLVAMNLPKKVHVKIHNGGTHCTDLKTVCLSTDFFDNKKLSVGEKLDIFLGAAVHEGCHVLYTTTLHATCLLYTSTGRSTQRVAWRPEFERYQNGKILVAESPSAKPAEQS